MTESAGRCLSDEGGQLTLLPELCVICQHELMCDQLGEFVYGRGCYDTAVEKERVGRAKEIGISATYLVSIKVGMAISWVHDVKAIAASHARRRFVVSHRAAGI